MDNDLKWAYSIIIVDDWKIQFSLASHILNSAVSAPNNLVHFVSIQKYASNAWQGKQWSKKIQMKHLMAILDVIASISIDRILENIWV